MIVKGGKEYKHENGQDIIIAVFVINFECCLLYHNMSMLISKQQSEGSSLRCLH